MKYRQTAWVAGIFAALFFITYLLDKELSLRLLMYLKGII